MTGAIADSVTDSDNESMGRNSAERGDVLLRVRNLKKYFPVKKGLLKREAGSVRAVDDISFDVYSGETLGLVGESGSGKTTAGRTILQLEKPTSGSVDFDGHSLAGLGASELRTLRRRMQMIFQDPHASLNPRMTVASIVSEPLQEHEKLSQAETNTRIEKLLLQVGLHPSHANRYPHEFSGGQRQRIGIARAMALNPDLIVCDEPIAALDVSIQAQVVNLLKELQAELGLTYLFISHDLSMIRHMADRVAVMYLGKIVELADVDDLYDNPKHPYTQALQSAVPLPDPFLEARRERVILVGDIPSPSNPPSGCRFRTRCPIATDICASDEPAFAETTPGHWVACHFVDSASAPSKNS